MNLLQVHDLVKDLGILDEDLDDWVHDVASEIASNVNNGGVAKQVDFLFEHIPTDSLVNCLKRYRRDK